MLVNMTLSSAADVVARFGGGSVYSALGPKWSLTVSYVCQAVVGFLFIFIWGANWVVAFMVLLVKLAVASAYALNFNTTAQLFPTEYSATIFGACNFSARLSTIVAPIIAEVDRPVPMVVLTSLSVAAMLCVLLMRVK